MASTGWRRAAQAPVGLCVAFVLLATVLSAGGRWSWFCDLFTHFRPQLTAASALACLVALLLRHRRLIAFAAAALLVNALLAAPVVWASTPVEIADGRPVRVASFNVAFFNPHFAAVGPYLESLHADVLALQEVPAPQMAALLVQLPSYPYHYLEANTGNYGVAVLSHWPLADMHVVELGVADRNGAQVAVLFPDARLTLTTVHLLWPVIPSAARQRNSQMLALAPALAACRGACVAIGDFNSTRWSSHFQDLLRDSGMRDCVHGPWVPPTWPSWPSWGLPLRIRIDQCLANGDVAVTRVSAGPAVGSDHLSTINDLRIARTPRK